MSKKQSPPTCEVSDLQDQNNKQYSRYSKAIIKNETPLCMWASYAEKHNTLKNTKCLFVMYKSKNNQMRVGYAKVVYNRDPLIRREIDITKNVHIADICSVSIIDDDKLSIKYVMQLNEEIKNWVFEFSYKKVLEDWLNILITQTTNLKKPIDLTSKEREQLTSEIKHKEQQRSNLLEKYNEIEQRYHNSEIIIQALSKTQKNLKQQVQQLKTQNDELEKKNKQAQKQIINMTEQIHTLRESSKKNQEIVQAQLSKQIQSSKIQQQQLKKNFTNEQNKLKEQKEKYEAMIQQNKKKLDTLSAQNEKLKNDIKQLRQICDRITYDKNSLRQANDKLKTISQKQKQTISQLNDKIKNLNAQIQKMEDKHSCLKVELQSKVTEMGRKQQQNSFLKLQGLFIGNALEDYPNHKSFLKETLQSLKNMQILRTRLLFKFNPFSKVNFHHYIDNEPDIVLIVKTSEGAFLAGYSESPFSPLNNANGKGMIISITNQMVFPLLQDKKSVIYDDYYIIFGNSEIRLKSMQSTIFSNFGIANGFYDHQGQGIQALLCNINREIGIETYEVHRIYFGE